MNRLSERVRSAAVGLVMLGLAVLLLLFPDNGYTIVVSVYGLGMALSGLKLLWYFITLARLMVGGRIMLYLGVIYLDFGIFTLTLTDVPRIYILLYLLACHLFAGFVDFLRALEARGLGAGTWKLNAIFGLINIGMAILGLVFLKSEGTVVYIFAAGLFYAAIIKIVSAFRKTAVVYIQ